jgi:hypothetical protein
VSTPPASSSSMSWTRWAANATPGWVGNDERDQTLNQLLVELDGILARQAIVVLAATNRADILDADLLRPGRFDRHISVSLPTRAGRLAILRVHMRHTPLDEGVSLERLARLTTGMSGANLVNEAALHAATWSGSPAPASRRRCHVSSWGRSVPSSSPKRSVASSPFTRRGTPWWPTTCRRPTV